MLLKMIVLVVLDDKVKAKECGEDMIKEKIIYENHDRDDVEDGCVVVVLVKHDVIVDGVHDGV